MIDGVTGDPGSCSQLGGAFRSHAARLTVLRGELAERTERLRRDPAATATVTDLDADLRHQRIRPFDGRLAEIAVAVRRLEGEAAAAGLELDGLRVVEPWGVLTTELAQQRHRAQPDLQRQADRLASQLGRARIATTRVMVDGTAALAAAATTSRTRSLR